MLAVNLDRVRTAITLLSNVQNQTFHEINDKTAMKAREALRVFMNVERELFSLVNAATAG